MEKKLTRAQMKRVDQKLYLEAAVKAVEEFIIQGRSSYIIKLNEESEDMSYKELKEQLAWADQRFGRDRVTERINEFFMNDEADDDWLYDYLAEEEFMKELASDPA